MERIAAVIEANAQDHAVMASRRLTSADLRILLNVLAVVVFLAVAIGLPFGTDAARSVDAPAVAPQASHTVQTRQVPMAPRTLSASDFADR